MRALKVNLFLFALITVVTAMTGCASTILQGKIKNGLYIAPSGIFSCPIPYSKLAHPVQAQDTLEKENGVVMAGSLRFIGLAGVYRIDYTMASNTPFQDKLNRMLNIQLDWYRRIPSPNAYVLHQEFNNDRLFAVLVAPEGQLGITDNAGKHPDLCRSMLIFKKGNFIYAVSTDANDSLEAKSSDKSPERLASLRKQVSEFADTIKFLTATN